MQEKDSSERSMQDWLERIIAKNELQSVIEGATLVDSALRDSESAELWPEFPIDYLARLRVLQSARSVLDQLADLELVSTSGRSISRTYGEAMYVDLLCFKREGARFVVFELKSKKATAREAVTELLAYEHEIMNHIPFASAQDILLVVVSREFSVLLDHAVVGLVTWQRRRVLCLRFEDSGACPKLHVHIPSAWKALGQGTLPATGIQIAHLCLYPRRELTHEESFCIFDTASALLAREAERIGGSGFVMVAEDHLFPQVTHSPFVMITGAINPFGFLSHAQGLGLAGPGESPVSTYLLSDLHKDEMPDSWEWLASAGRAVVQYLGQFGTPSWEGFSDWNSFRDVRRLRSNIVTPDRHLCPVSVDFWGILGDYARDLFRNSERLKNFMPNWTKPGLDWRNPHVGVNLLDNVAITPVVRFGEWTFSALFSLGIRLGRLASVALQFANSDEEVGRKLKAGLFWSEVDVLGVVHELVWRYRAAEEVKKPPPTVPIGGYENGADVSARFNALFDWVSSEFVGTAWPMLQAAFITGLKAFALYDALVDANNPDIRRLRSQTAGTARNWLIATVTELDQQSVPPDNRLLLMTLAKRAFGGRLPLDAGRAAALEAIAALDEASLIDGLFQDIPEMVGCWHPQLAHTVAPASIHAQDWDWIEQQVRDQRRRGVKHPCIFISAGGQVAIGSFPENMQGIPEISDPDTEVLLSDSQTCAEIVMRVKWADLRDGRAGI